METFGKYLIEQARQVLASLNHIFHFNGISQMNVTRDASIVIFFQQVTTPA